METLKDITTKTVSLYAFFRPKKEHAATLRKELLALVAPTRQEKGNIVYNIHEEKDGMLFIYELWHSQEDLDKHNQLPHVKNFIDKLGDWLATDLEIYTGPLISK